MTPRLPLFVILVALAGCGSDDDGAPPTLSTPPPPVTTPLNGVYDLEIGPDASCGLPAAPYVVPLDVTSFAGTAGNELRATLPGGASTLVLEMLYDAPGRLQGALSTESAVPLTDSTWLRLRNNGIGTVSLSDGGRPEVREGVMAGDVTYYPDADSALTCTSGEHAWSLIAR